MKIKRYCRLFLLLASLSLLRVPCRAANAPVFQWDSEAVLLMEPASGDVIFSKNPDKILPPASVTKIMTLLLVMEALDSGRIKTTDKIQASPEACRMGGSQIWLEPGEEMTVGELLKAVAIVSANDASYALAEYLHGSAEAFVQRMNERARELGMKHTYFANMTGLVPDKPGEKGNYTTAWDVAVMSRELLKHPRILKWTGTWIDYLRGGESFLRNTNNLVRFYRGCDGLKTGFTAEAGFCLSATAQKKGVRLLAVVMKAPTSKIRNKEISRMLNYGFSLYYPWRVYRSLEPLGKLKIRRGIKTELGYGPKNDIIVPAKRDRRGMLDKEIRLSHNLLAPVRRGSRVGEIILSRDGNVVAKADLVALEDVRKAGIIRLTFQFVLETMRNIFH
ncbi:MAG: D-alanyl-D-alanine carboxypeptidase family protein [Bacillota bacterium]